MRTGRSIGVGSSLLGVALACLAAPAAVAHPAAPPPPSCRVIRYHSAPKLRAQRACMNLGVTTHGTKPGTYLFLTPGGIAGLGAGIYEDNGTLVWWQRHTRADFNLTVVHYRGHPYLALWTQSVAAGRYDEGTVTLYNQHYQRVGTITAQGAFRREGIDVHEFRITPQGDAIFGIYDIVPATFQGRRYEVGQCVIQEVALIQTAAGIHSRRLLFQWESLNHVPVSQSYIPAPAHNGVWDYFHGNSIAQDTGGNLVVSARNTWAIYEISVKTGRIIWQVGGKGDHRIAQPWCYEHDIVPLGGDRYSVFDDGGSGPGCQTGSTGHPARGLIVRVDPSLRPAGVRLIRSYSHDPPIYSGYCGGMQRLADGGALIDWGNVPEVTEYAADGAARMDLSLSAWSYRAFRFPWVGEPLTRPDVAAQHTASGTDVWASWNGSTQVAAWRVLAGPRAARLSAVGRTAPKTGFETQIVLQRPYAAVSVQALGASGRVLATSPRVRPAS